MPVGRNELFADLTRSVGPSSAGIVITRDQLRAALVTRLHAAAGLPGSACAARMTKTSTEGARYRPRSYATGDVGLQWRWQEEFSLLRDLRLHLAGIR